MDQFESYKHFLTYIENNYDEEQQLIIEDFISYYINIYNGFGHKNCELSYQESLHQDTDGALHKLALIGFEFEKKIFDKFRSKNKF